MPVSKANENPPADTEAPSAVVLVIDRLRAGSIGPYGNTSIDTPEVNQWAASGVVFDQAIASALDLSKIYDSWWSAFSNKSLPNAPSSFLVSDDPQVAQHQAADFFDEVQLVSRPSNEDHPKQPAESAADTQMANFFAQATESLSNVQPGTLLWLHSRGMSELWDAPVDYRLNQCGPDDPPPPEFVQAPSEWVDPADADPDQLLGLEQAYAAQVILLDQLLSVFSETLRHDARFTNTWLILTSSRGYPLGQHGIVGDAVAPDFAGTALHQENLHVPLIVCPPGKFLTDVAAARCGQLMPNKEISSLLGNIFAGSGGSHLMQYVVRPGDASFQQSVATRHESATAIQTVDWKLITDGRQHRLYSKPDDRWEVNNVADRCPIELEEMQQMLSDQDSAE